MACISPEELEEKIKRGIPLVILDIRHPLELENGSYGIRGAVDLTLEKLAAYLPRIPLDREVVLYCS